MKEETKASDIRSDWPLQKRRRVDWSGRIEQVTREYFSAL